MFYIIDHYYGEFPEYRHKRNNTTHMSTREARLKKAKNLCRQERAKIIDAFIVDKGHEDGEEIHWILSNGVILITNYYTNRLVTVLIGRVGQIKRYYREFGETPPESVLIWAQKHQKAGYNRI